MADHLVIEQLILPLGTRADVMHDPFFIASLRRARNNHSDVSRTVRQTPCNNVTILKGIGLWALLGNYDLGSKPAKIAL